MSDLAKPTSASPLTTAVVLCAYNGSRFLPSQLDSLYAQTRLPACVVLSDDASSDDSAGILADALQRFEALGVRVILNLKTENVGYVRHFEEALGLADAEVVFPCDQDDLWYAAKIERMSARFEADPALDVLHSDADLIDAQGARVGKRLLEVLEMAPREMKQMTAGDAFDVLIRRNVVTGAAMAFRRRVLARARPFPAEWAHDEWIALVAALDGKVRTTDEVLLGYRQHDSNQIGVRARGVLHKVAGIAGYRKEFLARMQARYEVLLARSRGMEWLTHDRAACIEARVQHARRRNSNASALLPRLPNVLRELSNGHYHRFGNGLRSALVDLLGLD